MNIIEQFESGVKHAPFSIFPNSLCKTRYFFSRHIGCPHLQQAHHPAFNFFYIWRQDSYVFQAFFPETCPILRKITLKFYKKCCIAMMQHALANQRITVVLSVYSLPATLPWMSLLWLLMFSSGTVHVKQRSIFHLAENNLCSFRLFHIILDYERFFIYIFRMHNNT